MVTRTENSNLVARYRVATVRISDFAQGNLNAGYFLLRVRISLILYFRITVRRGYGLLPDILSQPTRTSALGFGKRRRVREVLASGYCWKSTEWFAMVSISHFVPGSFYAMVFGYLRGLIFISVLQLVLSIPLESLGESTETILVTAVITTQLEVLETTTIFSPNPLPTSPGELPSNELDSSTSEILVVTAIVTETPTTTITVTEIPSGSTDITTALPSTSQTSLPQRVWAAPSQFTDLSSFKVSSFPYGQHNLQLVTQPPTNDTATLAIPQVQAVAAGTNATLSEPQQYPSLGAPPLEDPHSLLQIFYPQGSINPGSDIQGGADFYASPLDLSRARSVSLEYSVFFPVGFEWALAGKLPGLYGGHTGCSGGNNARTCFSTRLMWRKEGKGELYLVCKRPIQSYYDAN